jgi:mono/diheme cytochrome c family protein
VPIGRRCAVIAALLLVTGGPRARAQDDGAERGRQLFAGTIPFTHGGPACASCHDMAALARPGGGAMGPDLTNIAARIGPEGVAAALHTLYFPTMAPLFNSHPLTGDERAALSAFLERPTSGAPRPPFAITALGAAAIVGGMVLLGITGLAGRSRVRSVRGALLARVAAAQKARS